MRSGGHGTPEDEGRVPEQMPDLLGEHVLDPRVDHKISDIKKVDGVLEDRLGTRAGRQRRQPRRRRRRRGKRGGPKISDRPAM